MTALLIAGRPGLRSLDFAQRAQTALPFRIANARRLEARGRGAGTGRRSVHTVATLRGRLGGMSATRPMTVAIAVDDQIDDGSTTVSRRPAARRGTGTVDVAIVGAGYTRTVDGVLAAPSPTRRCGCSWSSARRSASGRRAATAGGASANSPAGWRGRSRRYGRGAGHPADAGDHRHRRRDRPGARRRADRLRVRQGWRDPARPHALHSCDASATRSSTFEPCGLRRRGRRRSTRSAAVERARRHRRSSAGCTTGRAPASIRRVSCTGSPLRSSDCGGAIVEHTRGHRASGRAAPGRAGGAPPGRRSPTAGSSPPTSSCGRPRPTPATCRATGASLVPLYSLMIATEPLPAGRVGRDRPARPRDVLRRPADGDLRAAHDRRPDRVRWPRRALRVRLAGSTRRWKPGRPTTTASRRRCASCCR